MPAKKRGSNRVWVDPDDAPEWTQEQFDRAEIAVGDKVVRPAQGTLTRPRGWPKKAVRRTRADLDLSKVDWRRVAATTDREIAKQIAADPDTAPIFSARELSRAKRVAPPPLNTSKLAKHKK
jgi:hypothetical protein